MDGALPTRQRRWGTLAERRYENGFASDIQKPHITSLGGVVGQEQLWRPSAPPFTSYAHGKEVQKLDVDRVTLYNWKNQLLGREASASLKQDKLSLAESDRDNLEQQVKTLKRDIHNLQLEHDLLKKANEL